METVKEFFSKNTKTISIITIIIVVLVVIYFVYWRRRGTVIAHVPINPTDVGTSLQNPGTTEPFESKKEPTRIVLFYAPWCKYCHKLMDGDDSVWNQLQHKYADQKHIAIDQINGDEKPELATKFSIEGFPTILKIVDGKVTKFQGDRTIEQLDAFINEN
jgi:thiol-disulfide isomerase/thioredoxin